MNENHELTLQVTGMDCTNCAATVEQGVARLNGVQACKVIFTAEQLRVSGDIERDEVVGRIRELGYDVIEDEDEAASPSKGQKKERTLLGYLWGRRDTRWALIAGLLVLPGVFVTEIGGREHWLINVLAVLALAVTGFPVMRSGWQNLRINHNLNINALMTIAAVGALFIGAYMEAAMVIVLFVLGEALEGYTAGNARHAIQSLIDVAPNTALKLSTDLDGAQLEEEVDVAELVVGDIVIVRPGDRVPMDGLVLAGQSAVDQAPITGESVPVDKGIEDEVFAGSINGTGVLEVEVTRLAKDNTISRIVQLVQEAQEAQAPTQRYIDRFAAVYTPGVVVLATLVAILPPLFLGQPFLNAPDGTFGWLYRGLALLVVACPCALVISTPVSIISGISNGARNGILIKGGAFLERLADVKVFALDKTGTLTQGQPSVVHVRANGCEIVEPAKVNASCPACDELVALAGAVERRSEHPFALAVVGEANRRHVVSRYSAGMGVSALTGNGVQGTVNGHQVLVGSHPYFDSNVPHSKEQCAMATVDAEQGLTPIMVSVDGDYFGTITVADTIRESSKAAIADLGDAGVDAVVMLTGDVESTARTIAAEAGVTDVRAGLKPADKATAIAELRDLYGPIAMVGDGINDAPALAAADVGIAIGAAHGGTAQALESADVTLMSDDLNRLGYAYRLARATIQRVRANIIFSIGIKAIFMLLVILGMSTMWMAVAADVGVALLVTFNGLRLLRWNPPKSTGVLQAKSST